MNGGGESYTKELLYTGTANTKGRWIALAATQGRSWKNILDVQK